jgi:hypothetical protein
LWRSPFGGTGADPVSLDCDACLSDPDCNVYAAAIGIGATAALIGSRESAG